MTKYLNIYKFLKKSIENRKFKPGEKLPSIRKIADNFNCNKLTAKKAFDKLNEEGFIEKKVGKGSFVRYPASFKEKVDNLYDFSSSYISEDFLLFNKIKKFINKLLLQEKKSLFSQSDIRGINDFIKTLSKRYRVKKEDMMIISGAQQGLDISSKVFNIKINKNILFEDPTYSGAVSIFKPDKFVDIKDDGPDIKQLKKKIDKTLKLFYTMPSIHNPTGISYSLEKKELIANLALKNNFYIIEDDYLSEFLKDNRKRFIDIIPERTIYIKSFSKIIAPGVRLGLMVFPDKLKDKFIEKKFTSDIVSSTFMQKILNIFIKEGYLSEHIKNLKKIYNYRRNELINILSRYDYLHFKKDFSGYNIWIKSDKKIKLENPPWAKGSNFSFSKKYKNYFRLSFMGMSETDFKHGLSYLNNIFDKINKSREIIY